MATGTSEARRQQALQDLRILDSGPDPGLDRIVEIVRRVFEVPIAAVSLVDADRQWFKAQYGAAFPETARRVAFCDHTIRSDDVFHVQDAAQDARFALSALVAGSPFVRFYAGAPLVAAPGVRLGALCIMGGEPRGLSPRERELLQLFADEACDLLQRRRLALQLEDEVARRREKTRTLVEQSQKLARSEKVFQQVSRLAKIGTWTLDPDNEEMSWSQEIYSILEVRRDFRPDLKSGLGLVIEEHQQRLLELITNAVRSGEAFETEIALRTGLGNLRWLRILGEPEAPPSSRRMFGTVQDVTGQRNAEAEMNRLATTDSLTGLPNRYVFGKAIETALASSRAPHGGALLLLDLDDFKDVNDTLGHDAGDHLLKVLAQRLRSILRRSDSIGRLGGDEFGVFLRGHGRVPDVGGIARLMLESATAPVVYLGHTLHVGASIGVARFPDDAGDVETLLKRADIALYTAKHGGGDRFCFFSGELGEAVERRARVLRELRRGLDAGQLTVAYQPLLNLRERAVVGFEALLRWAHPERGLLAAGSFLEALEEPALGRMLSDASMELAIPQFAAWTAAGEQVGRLSLNVSVGQLRDTGFVERFLELVEAASLDPRLITLELTEGVLLGRGSENVARRIGALHDMGVQIALDDFGTGYASLTHLRQFPVDILKIDASFVRSLHVANANRTIVRTVIEMAHSLGMRAVAEGVEEPEIDALLKLMGCDLGQGYLYGRPMPADAVPGFVRGFGYPAFEAQRSRAAVRPAAAPRNSKLSVT